MNNSIKFLDNILSLVLILSILLSSFGREVFSNTIFLNYFFWFSLGMYLGFQCYKYQVKKYWKDVNNN